MKTSDKIVQHLKTQGALTAKTLAAELQLTTMGIRQHLLTMEAEGIIAFEDKKALRGRPTRFWFLTQKSNPHFENRHEELTIQLIDSVKNIFGDNGLEKLISHREQTTQSLYKQALMNCNTVEEKLLALADLRSQEGYMASVEQENDVWWLYENHCPICAAATKCQNFCRSELQLFQSLFIDIAHISREEHIVAGARRCAYKVITI